MTPTEYAMSAARELESFRVLNRKTRHTREEVEAMLFHAERLRKSADNLVGALMMESGR
jgi:hypothetical protein